MTDFPTISILAIILASSIITLAVGYLYSKIQKRRYDEKDNKAILDGIRSSLEKQMYIINDRLIQNEERWKDVNHLLIRNEYLDGTMPIANSGKTYYSEFLKSNGITQNDLNIDPRLVFILTPFNDRYFEDYKVIREVCTSLGFKCYRGDENYFKGDIFPEMLKLIVKANLIIANINGRNPNVLYELGIAQALDKSVLLISKEPEQLPIDIQSKRFLIYSDYKHLQSLLHKELTNLPLINE